MNEARLPRPLGGAPPAQNVQQLPVAILSQEKQIGIVPFGALAFFVDTASGMVNVNILAKLVRVSPIAGQSRAMELPIRTVWRIPINEAIEMLEAQEKAQLEKG
jgi:hypothetical protein